MAPRYPKSRSQIALLCRSVIAISCCAVLFFLAPNPARAGLFESDEVLSVVLEGPLAETLRDTESRVERPFQLIVGDASLDIAVRVRGKSRAERCRFPPLRLNFKSADADDTVFAGLGKLKLVTHCKKSEHFEQNLLEEYAAYRMFSLLSEFSHRVRLLRIRYVDTSEPDGGAVVRYAFVLEPIEQVAERMGAEVQHVPHVVKSSIALEQAGLVFAYHYLIANTDWSLVTATDEETCCHNGSLLRRGDQNYLVPYDFDLAGFVNARYAKPDPGLSIRRVTARLYRGYCLDGLDIAKSIEAIVASEAEILAVVRALPDAPRKDADRRVSFLAGFFESARREGLAERFESSCVG